MRGTTIYSGGLFTAAWRNFIRNLRRYRVLLVALILIVMALTGVLGTMLGLQEAVREKAGRYFAGDLVVLGYQGTGSSLIEDPQAVAAAVEALAAGAPLADALETGQAVAGLTIARAGAVRADLTPALLASSLAARSHAQGQTDARP